MESCGTGATIRAAASAVERVNGADVSSSSSLSPSSTYVTRTTQTFFIVSRHLTHHQHLFISDTHHLSDDEQEVELHICIGHAVPLGKVGHKGVKVRVMDMAQ